MHGDNFFGACLCDTVAPLWVAAGLCIMGDDGDGGGGEGFDVNQAGAQTGEAKVVGAAGSIERNAFALKCDIPEAFAGLCVTELADGPLGYCGASLALDAGAIFWRAQILAADMQRAEHLAGDACLTTVFLGGGVGGAPGSLGHGVKMNLSLIATLFKSYRLKFSHERHIPTFPHFSSLPKCSTRPRNGTATSTTAGRTRSMGSSCRQAGLSAYLYHRLPRG